MKLSHSPELVVILGTGGTIAGKAETATDSLGYRAAQLGVDDLVAAIPALRRHKLELEQVAQLDSKDMDHATWQRLALRAHAHLARPEVAGVVITHGTDTLEETAYFLHRVLETSVKPVVLTAAMRPATSIQADGPQNLLDAVMLVRTKGARGVLVAVAGQVHGAEHVSKRHSYRLNAFESGDAGLVAVIEDGCVRKLNTWPNGSGLGIALVACDVKTWPRIDIVISHAGADGLIVEALARSGSQGILVAGTGNGTVHKSLQAALQVAEAQGIAVWRSTRCPEGAVIGGDSGAWPSKDALNAGKARIEMLLAALERASIGRS